MFSMEQRYSTMDASSFQSICDRKATTAKQCCQEILTEFMRRGQAFVGYSATSRVVAWAQPQAQPQAQARGTLSVSLPIPYVAAIEERPVKDDIHFTDHHWLLVALVDIREFYYIAFI